MAKKAAPVKRGRGRPKLEGGSSVVVAVSLPGDLSADLDAHCKAKGVGKSAAVVEALRGFLKRKKR
jgi:metal-responsive CopG/Arc/MetJ family transcriptional regulator